VHLTGDNPSVSYVVSAINGACATSRYLKKNVCICCLLIRFKKAVLERILRVVMLLLATRALPREVVAVLTFKMRVLRAARVLVEVRESIVCKSYCFVNRLFQVHVPDLNVNVSDVSVETKEFASTNKNKYFIVFTHLLCKLKTMHKAKKKSWLDKKEILLNTSNKLLVKFCPFRQAL
jgi:hypothetical protein